MWYIEVNYESEKSGIYGLNSPRHISCCLHAMQLYGSTILQYYHNLIFIFHNNLINYKAQFILRKQYRLWGFDITYRVLEGPVFDT